MLPINTGFAGRRVETVVDVRNRTVSDVGLSQVRRAGIRVNSTGTVDLYDSDTGWVYSYSWIKPTYRADNLYQVRITGVTFNEGSSFFTSTYAENTWGSVSANPAWEVRDADSGSSGNVNVDFTLEIRYDGGATIDTASISLIATWDIS